MRRSRRCLFILPHQTHRACKSQNQHLQDIELSEVGLHGLLQAHKRLLWFADDQDGVRVELELLIVDTI